MNLSSALSLINSSFTANAAQTTIVSRNISNASTPGYAKEVANLSTGLFGGAYVAGVTRETDGALQAQVLDSTSKAAGQQAIADGIATLAQTVNDSASASSSTGATQNGNSPSAMIANLQAALETAIASPTSQPAAQGVLDAAKDLVRSLNGASAVVDGVREQADSHIAASVSRINAMLAQYNQADASVVSGLQSGADVSSAEDTRDQILTSLSQQLGISTVQNQNGSIYLYTDSGVPLYVGQPTALSFTPTPAMSAGSTGNQVMANGIPITGASAPMAVKTGALAGYVSLRDSIAPQYQSQLDELAGGLINGFAETDQSATPSLPALPGLFSTYGGAALPTSGETTGLAGSITVNANVDPSQGGDLNLLRDGGISDPTNPAYNYNPTDASSFTGRLQSLAQALSTPRNFDPAADLGTTASLSNFANASVSWVAAQDQKATSEADYQNALLTQASAALSNVTGVNLDAEMTNMLSLENNYSTTAKLLTTVNAMFSALISAV